VKQKFDDFNYSGGAFKKSTILSFLQLGSIYKPLLSMSEM
jgi:hypothetical protein